ncbi:MAG: hypothetical protein P4L39_11755 [Humidesulfovibrio sp.]|nr:hypothetical protein [Humidesulfovibrio sp.]
MPQLQRVKEMLENEMKPDTPPFSGQNACTSCSQTLYGEVLHCPFCGVAQPVVALPSSKSWKKPPPPPVVEKPIVTPPPPPPVVEKPIVTPPPPPPVVEKPIVTPASPVEDKTGESRAKHDAPSPVSPWLKPAVIAVSLIMVLGLGYLMLNGTGTDRAVETYAMAETAFINRDMATAKGYLDKLLAKDTNNPKASALLGRIQDVLKRHTGLMADAESLTRQGKAEAAAKKLKTIMSEDISNRQAQEKLQAITNSQANKNSICQGLYVTASEALARNDVVVAQQAAADAQATGCSQASSIVRLVKSHIASNPSQDERGGKSAQPPRTDNSQALAELKKAKHEVDGGNWKIGRQMAESILSLAGGDPKVKAEALRIIAGSEVEKKRQMDEMTVK